MESLAEAQQYVRTHLEDGVQCPCCEQYARAYRRLLNANMALFLCSLVAVAGPDREWVYYKDIEFTSRDYSYLKHWGLAEEKPRDPEDTAKKSSGFWRPTRTGIEFARSKIQVPKRVYLYNNAVLGFDDEMTTVREALDKKFDYAELMRGFPEEETMGRMLFAHPKQGWDDAKITQSCAFLEAATGSEIIHGREAYDLYFAACGRNWERWAQKLGAGVELDGTPLFEAIIVPGPMVARATAQICEQALRVQRPVLVWQDHSGRFIDKGHGFAQAHSMRDEQPHNRFFGWRLIC